MTCNVDGGYILQVTATGARLVDAGTGALRASWSPPAGASVSVAAANRTQVLLATTGGTLVSLAAGSGGGDDDGGDGGDGGDDAMDTGGEATGGGGGGGGGGNGLLREVATAELGHEIACMDCSPLTDPGAASASLCAVGLWSTEVCVLSMPDLKRVSSAPLAPAEVGVAASRDSS